jgi:hypothetical protein
MVEGVMSSVGMGILLSANVTAQKEDEPLYIHMKEGPFSLTNGENNQKYVYVKHWPVEYPLKKTFIFDYDRDAI